MTTINRRRSVFLAVLATLALLLAACSGGSDDDASTATTVDGATDTATDDGAETDDPDETGDPVEQPVVVASTSWVASFAKAAGIDDVTIVAPVDLLHPPDYDPKPSDLVAVADADYVLLAGFEGFAERMLEAVEGDAVVIELHLDNELDTIRENVETLADAFDTHEAANAWLDGFDARIAELQAELDEARPDETPTAVAHGFMDYWGDYAGIEVVGTYGPEPPSASQLAEFTAADPDLILTNAHVPAGGAFDDLDAPQIPIANFPDDSLELIGVFEANTKLIIEAFGSL